MVGGMGDSYSPQGAAHPSLCKQRGSFEKSLNSNAAVLSLSKAAPEIFIKEAAAFWGAEGGWAALGDSVFHQVYFPEQFGAERNCQGKCLLPPNPTILLPGPSLPALWWAPCGQTPVAMEPSLGTLRSKSW